MSTAIRPRTLWATTILGLMSAHARAGEAAPAVKALSEAKVIVDARLRLEHVEQVPFTEDAEATQVQQLDPARASSATYGLRLAGEHGWGNLKLAYAASAATQRDYGSNPLRFELDYPSQEAILARRQISLTLGREVLEGNGTVGFSTPLASMHKFGGWADKF